MEITISKHFEMINYFFYEYHWNRSNMYWKSTNKENNILIPTFYSVILERYRSISINLPF